MPSTYAFPKARSTAIRAVVTRADGRIIDLGLISYRHRNPFIHYAVNAYIALKDLFNDRSRSK